MDTGQRPEAIRDLSFVATSYSKPEPALGSDLQSSFSEHEFLGKTVETAAPQTPSSASALSPAHLPESLPRKVEIADPFVPDHGFMPSKGWRAEYKGDDYTLALKDLACLTEVRKIASGGQGDVMEFKDQWNRRFAVKKMHDYSEEKSKNLIQGEILSMAVAPHPNIVKTYGILLWNEKRHSFCLCQGDVSSLEGDLKDYRVAAVINEKVDGADIVDAVEGNKTRGITAFMPKCDYKLSAHIVIEVAKALSHLHDHDILYRDVKLDNILIGCDKGNGHTVQLTDFGLSKRLSKRGRTYSRSGTDIYISPEQIQNLSSRKSYAHAIDNWALGVALTVMATTYYPWNFAKGKKVDPDVELSFLRERNAQEYASWSDREKEDFFALHFDKLFRECKPIVDVIIGLTREDPAKRMSLDDVQIQLKDVAKGRAKLQTSFVEPKRAELI